MQNEHSASAHWRADFDESGLERWAAELRDQLGDRPVDLGLVFLSPRFFPQAAQILEILRVHARIPLLAGCSSASLIAGAEEIEDEAGIALGLFSLPGAELKAVHFTQEDLRKAGSSDYWVSAAGVASTDSHGWLVFADPFRMDCEGWLESWSNAYSGLPVLGGLASGNLMDQSTQLYLNGEVFEEGMVGVSIGGAVKPAGIIAQGCTPIGDTWTITRSERNIIHEIGNRPAYELLAKTFNELAPKEQEMAQGNLFIGLVIDEYLDEFQRGDFLIRNLLGADPRSGAIAVGALARAGQTIQFQRRDATAAHEDMTAMLAQARAKLAEQTVFGGCLCSCNGRGAHLFGKPSHDAGMVQEILGPFGMAGFFCNGEIGPVGTKNFLHGYTASLALFVPA